MKNKLILWALVIVGVGLGIWWILRSYQEHVRYLHAHHQESDNFLEEIAYNFREHSFVENEFQQQEEKNRDYIIDEGLDSVNDDRDEQANEVIEQTLGNAEMQVRLKQLITLLAKEGEEERWQADNLGWRALVSEEIAQTMRVNLKQLDQWWQDIESYESFNDLAIIYPDLQNSIWDLYVNRNDLRLLYANEVVVVQ